MSCNTCAEVSRVLALHVDLQRSIQRLAMTVREKDTLIPRLSGQIKSSILEILELVHKTEGEPK
jgi:hypothetical protein